MKTRGLSLCVLSLSVGAWLPSSGQAVVPIEFELHEASTWA